MHNLVIHIPFAKASDNEAEVKSKIWAIAPNADFVVEDGVIDLANIEGATIDQAVEFIESRWQIEVVNDTKLAAGVAEWRKAKADAELQAELQAAMYGCQLWSA